MNALIQITEREGQQAVDARELFNFLEVESRFNDWIKRRIKEYALVEGLDFSILKNEYGRESGTYRFLPNEYALTISCAKELAMVEGNAKGKAARLYFIECERRIKADDLQRRVTVLEAKVDQQSRQIALLTGKATRKTQIKLLPTNTEAALVQKHFAPAPVETGNFWTIPQVIDFLQQAERVKNLRNWHVGKALAQLCGPRFTKWNGQKCTWGYSVTLTA